ncbi:MAG: hypothetical protein HY738_17520 [Bacteroidia bacterium]|nr:hypothetical protein [Bacteroidia bacterium]
MKKFDKKTLDRIYSMYINEKFGYNEFCKECKKNIEFENGPVPLFHIGKNYKNNSKRIVFIGLVAYGWNDIITNQDKTWSEIFLKNQKVIDKTQLDIENRIHELYFLDHGQVKYLSYIKAACTKIFGSVENGFDNIAITNFVHCNLGEVRDTLPQVVRDYCANYNKAGFIHKELKILDPTHIVVLTTDEKKYTQFANDFDSKPKYLEVIHPSAPGRALNDFINEIENFYNK